MYKYTANFFQQFQQTISTPSLPDGAQGHVWDVYSEYSELPEDGVEDGDYAYIANEGYTWTYMRTSGEWKCIICSTETYHADKIPRDNIADGCVLKMDKGTRVYSTSLGKFVPQFVHNFGAADYSSARIVGDEVDAAALTAKGYTVSLGGSGAIASSGGFVQMSLGGTSNSNVYIRKFLGSALTGFVYTAGWVKWSIPVVSGTWSVKPFYGCTSATSGNIHVGLTNSTVNNSFFRVSSTTGAEFSQFGTSGTDPLLYTNTDPVYMEIFSRSGSKGETIIWINGNDNVYSFTQSTVETASPADGYLGLQLTRSSGTAGITLSVKDWRSYLFT